MIKEKEKVKKLENLAKACADATDNDMKKMWFDKLIDLAKKYDMREYVIIEIIDFKISMLNKLKRCLTGEAKMDENYKRWRKEVKEWAKKNR